MKSITLQSPAKLNLYLKVLGKRKDGFHNIETVFERINLCDHIRLTPNLSGKILVSCNHPGVPTGPKNLVYLAAKLLKKDFDIKKGVHIKITKRIPVAAGLAGGSSNAASVLLGLNRLWRLKLSQKRLLYYADQIGSDVAFFLHHCSWALGVGRGNNIKILKINKKLWHILVTPRLKLYAGQVYGGVKMRLTKKGDNASIFIHNLKKNKKLDVAEYLRNDLEAVVLRLKPRLRSLRKKLNLLNIKGVTISGSGPTMFGLIQSQREGQRLKSILSKHFSQVFVVRTL